MGLKLDTLKKAARSLRDALRLHTDEAARPELRLALRDSVIQRFEYTYELAWKALQRWLRENVSPEAAAPVYSRKELFRLAARAGLLDDPARWFSYHKARNVSAHTYDEQNAEVAFEAAQGLAGDVEALIERLTARAD